MTVPYAMQQLLCCVLYVIKNSVYCAPFVINTMSNTNPLYPASNNHNKALHHQNASPKLRFLWVSGELKRWKFVNNTGRTYRVVVPDCRVRLPEIIISHVYTQLITTNALNETTYSAYDEWAADVLRGVLRQLLIAGLPALRAFYSVYSAGYYGRV